MNDEVPWYNVTNIGDIDSPALVIYKERVQHNIALAIKTVSDVSKLRPHVKTHKSEETTLLMMEAGITKFKCATIAEAEMLGSCGASDVLLAYQPVGPKISRFISLVRKFAGTRFSCLVDNIASASEISNSAVASDITVNTFIDVNIGMNRTGVLPQEAFTLYERCGLLQGLQIIGLHGYDGHINDSGVELRTQRANAAYQLLENAKDEMIAAGSKKPTVVIGGSPTFPIHAKRKDVECSPGTFIYWDYSYNQLFQDMKFLPAALVISRVVSVVNDTTLCLDLGHKSIAAENALQHRVHFLNAPALQFVSQSEEHLVVEVTANHTYKMGDVFYGLPFHVCPTCALYDSAAVIEQGYVKKEWRMRARDRSISI